MTLRVDLGHHLVHSEEELPLVADHPFDLLADLGGRQSLVGVEQQHVLDQVLRALGHLRVLWNLVVHGLDALEQGGGFRFEERELAVEHRVKDDAQGPNVAGLSLVRLLVRRT